ncbi:hypothetical protein POL25_27365 [Nannocystis sp. bb15-2]|uniref:Uncharacterized protein n=1 Tax=Nannocystis bainbridge TaxID=2995303 RepID=A0ABT5E5N5_9BACT|nr:hypothetical protein [Nannocystis bainbridge]MDC0720654.1 hypothetical protein [Nannocystis bainbridge]
MSNPPRLPQSEAEFLEILGILSQLTADPATLGELVRPLTPEDEALLALDPATLPADQRQAHANARLRQLFQAHVNPSTDLGPSTMPDLGTLTMPDLGTPTMPDLGTLTMPDLGTPTMPDLGTLTMPHLDPPTMPDLGTLTMPHLDLPAMPDFGLSDPGPLTPEDEALIALDPATLTPEQRRARALAMARKLLRPPE